MRLGRRGAADMTVGIAGDGKGSGLAYVRTDLDAARVLRVPFSYTPVADADGLEVLYAGMSAVCATIRRMGFRRVRIGVEAKLLRTLRKGEDLPRSLSFPYVRLGCALNAFASVQLREAQARDADLIARANSELAMRIAA